EDIAIFGMLGFSRGSILSTLICESVLLGLLGAAFGVTLGIGLAIASRRLISLTFGSLLGVPVTDIAIGWPEVVSGAGVGLLLPLGATIFPILQATREPPLDGMRRAFRIHGDRRPSSW